MTSKNQDYLVTIVFKPCTQLALCRTLCGLPRVCVSFCVICFGFLFVVTMCVRTVDSVTAQAWHLWTWPRAFHDGFGRKGGIHEMSLHFSRYLTHTQCCPCFFLHDKMSGCGRLHSFFELLTGCPCVSVSQQQIENEPFSNNNKKHRQDENK